MAAISALIAGIGIAASLASTAVGFMGAQKQAKAQKQQMRLQMQQNEERRKQMNLEATRRRRAAIREAQMARSTALATAQSQGAQMSTGLLGGYASITGASASNQKGINQTQEIGNNIFDLENQITSAKMKEVSAGTLGYAAQGISSVGNMLTSNAGTIARIGGWS